MARFRVFDTETANQMVPRLSQSDTVDISNAGEYFSADSGEVILAPSVRDGDVLYIKIRSFVAAPAPVKDVVPKQAAKPPEIIERTPEPVDLTPASIQSSSKHYVASGFLGLDGEVEEEVPQAPKPWWKRLID